MVQKKKFSIKFICLFLITCILIASLSFGAGANNSEETINYSARALEIAEKQARALEAWSILFENFTINENGSVTYLDDFAGGWIEDFKLYIALTPDKSSIDYKNLLKEFDDVIVYVSAEHSLNELNELRFSVSEVLTKEYNIISHYVDEKQNKISLGVPELNESIEKNIESTLSSTLSELSSALFERNANENQLSEKNLYTDLFILREDIPATTEADVMGGMGISRESSSTIAPTTIGVCGTFTINGITYNGFVTHGHGMTSTNVIYHTGGSYIFGLVTYLSFSNGSWGDYSLVRITNGEPITNKLQSPTTGQTIQMTYAITTFEPPVGTLLCRFGQASGYSEITVTATNVSETLSGNTINGLTRGRVDWGTSQGGDSGGPYWLPNPNSAIQNSFAGIHTASNVPSGGNDVWFTSCMRFSGRFTVKTN